MSSIACLLQHSRHSCRLTPFARKQRCVSDCPIETARGIGCVYTGHATFFGLTKAFMEDQCLSHLGSHSISWGHLDDLAGQGPARFAHMCQSCLGIGGQSCSGPACNNHLFVWLQCDVTVVQQAAVLCSAAMQTWLCAQAAEAFERIKAQYAAATKTSVLTTWRGAAAAVRAAEAALHAKLSGASIGHHFSSSLLFGDGDGVEQEMLAAPRQPQVKHVVTTTPSINVY